MQWFSLIHWGDNKAVPKAIGAGGIYLVRLMDAIEHGGHASAGMKVASRGLFQISLAATAIDAGCKVFN